jgi:hypothetical protein
MGFTMDERLVPDPVNSLVVEIGPDAGRVAHELVAGDPSIRCIVEGSALVIVVETVREGEEALIVERLRQVLAA